MHPLPCIKNLISARLNIVEHAIDIIVIYYKKNGQYFLQKAFDIIVLYMLSKYNENEYQKTIAECLTVSCIHI